ncbi:T9SS type A sorting domain-containing protein [Melioribacter sp. OK-6-Me]|uniref:T9SS type A sorting domain-containing protein n=1 Tax=Melioribacter sp. OK-6-Me TaxID=3423433 RepID=UPI003ED84A20
MDKFYLKQNYPNPFNAVTNIDYYIPEAGEVKIIVIDALGRVLLYSGNKHEGKQSIEWYAS